MLPYLYKAFYISVNFKRNMLMKQIVQKLTLSLLLVFATATLVTAQTPEKGKATINSNLIVLLDVSTPLVADYVFDISPISFKDQAATERFFRIIHDNIVSYTLDYENKTATVHIALELMEPRGWDVNKYNDYFVKLSERYRSTLAMVNE